MSCPTKFSVSIEDIKRKIQFAYCIESRGNFSSSVKFSNAPRKENKLFKSVR